MKTYKTIKTGELLKDEELNDYSYNHWNLEHFATVPNFYGKDSYIYIFTKVV